MDYYFDPRLGINVPGKDPNAPQQSMFPSYQATAGKVAQGADFSGYQNQLQNLLTNPEAIQQTPAYQFALNQGNQAINRSAAAKGMLNSGNVLAELAKYGQSMASQEYGGQVNRLADLMRGAQNFGVSAGFYRPEIPQMPGMTRAPSYYQPAGGAPMQSNAYYQAA